MYFNLKIKWWWIVKTSKQTSLTPHPSQINLVNFSWLGNEQMISLQVVLFTWVKFWPVRCIATPFLFDLFFWFLNWKMSRFLWAVEAWTLKKINELFCPKLMYFTNVHSRLCTLHVVPAAVVFHVTCILLRKLEIIYWYNAYLREIILVYL